MSDDERAVRDHAALSRERRPARLRRRDRIVLETLLPSNAHPVLPNGILDAGFEEFYRDFKGTANRQLQYAFALGMVAATWIAPLLIGRMPPLGRHRRDTRERALGAMETSRFYLVRQLMVVLKTVISLCYGS